MTKEEQQTWRFSRMARFVNEALRRYKMRLRQKDLVLYVIDITWGEFRDSSRVTKTAVAKEFGWDPSDARKEIKELLAAKVLRQPKNSTDRSRYQLNTRVEEWEFQWVNDRPKRPPGKMPKVAYWEESLCYEEGGRLTPHSTNVGGTLTPPGGGMPDPPIGGTPDPPPAPVPPSNGAGLWGVHTKKDLILSPLPLAEGAADDDQDPLREVAQLFAKLAEKFFVVMNHSERRNIRRYVERHLTTAENIALAKDAFRLGCERVKADDTKSRAAGRDTWRCKIKQALAYAEETMQEITQGDHQ